MNNLAENAQIQNFPEIETRIYTLRGVQIMLDHHLAELYGVEVKRMNEQVKRNLFRFPDSFMFQLNQDEFEFLRSQFATLEIDDQFSHNDSNIENRGKHRKYLPYAFTEQGVAMLSAVLRTEAAIKVSIQIMNAFISMRKFVHANAELFKRIELVENKQTETDRKFDQVFKALEEHKTEHVNGVFFDGQIFDAYVFVSELIRSAKKSILLIDNYIDETVLLLLTKRNRGVRATIYTQLQKSVLLDVEKHNKQYEPVEIKELTISHDHFIILDEKELYHIGASLKDLGKKWFAFSRLNAETIKLLDKLDSIKRGEASSV